MFCLPQDLNQLVLGELRLSWSSVLCGGTQINARMLVTKEDKTLGCHFHLAAEVREGFLAVGEGTGALCRTAAQGAAGRSADADLHH